MDRLSRSVRERSTGLDEVPFDSHTDTTTISCLCHGHGQGTGRRPRTTLLDTSTQHFSSQRQSSETSYFPLSLSTTLIPFFSVNECSLLIDSKSSIVYRVFSCRDTYLLPSQQKIFYSLSSSGVRLPWDTRFCDVKSPRVTNPFALLES